MPRDSSQRGEARDGDADTFRKLFAEKGPLRSCLRTTSAEAGSGGGGTHSGLADSRR